jgi:hypothetical protein
VCSDLVVIWAIVFVPLEKMPDNLISPVSNPLAAWLK